jgi:dipeptidyl aminopeptidase/acylaminoacyl peptidase
MIHKGFTRTVSTAVAMLFAVAVYAQQQTLTPEMVVSLKTVSSVTIDPTGKNIAYILTTPRGPDEETGSRYSELFVIPAAGGAPRQFTYKPNDAGSPQWSPDGKWIYFTSLRKEFDGQIEVYRIPIDGGEAGLAGRSSNGVRQFKLAPDGKWIAYTMTDAPTPEEKSEAKKGDDVQIVDKNFKQHRLYVQAVGSNESKSVSGEMSVWDFEWSPDGSQIVFQASATPRTDDSYMFKKLYMGWSNAHMPPKVLTETKGKLGSMAWSPDGKQIAFLGGVDESDPTNGSIFVVSATGGEAKNLSQNYEGTVTWVGWLDTATLIFSATERSHTALNTMSVKDGALKRIIDSGYAMSSASATADGKMVALAANTYKHHNEVFVCALATKKMTRLTNSNPELDNLRFSGTKEISWKAKDGLEITGLLMLPLDYQPGTKYPCIVQVHGGPESAYVEGWTTSYVTWSELLAARGYVVFSPNYRGSTGRGVAYSKADHQDLGGKEFDDVLDGIDFLVQQGYVDPERVGIGGFSYGGYFSAWAATRHTERFKAASMGAGIANWISFTGTSDIPYENSMVHWNLEIFKNMEKVWNRSPLAHVEKSQTALLISHGEKDDRVPIGQGWEIYTAMKLLGKAVEFDIYPREAHGWAERHHQLYSIKRNLEWFEKYVKGGTTNKAGSLP